MRSKGACDKLTAGLHCTNIVIVAVYPLLVGSFHFGLFSAGDFVACCNDELVVGPRAISVLDELCRISDLGTVYIVFDDGDKVAVFG